MNRFEELKEIIPTAPNYIINWDHIECSFMKSFSGRLKQTYQDPTFHREGNVWEHTKLVCECLVDDDEFRKLKERQQQEVFLAALFHDVGKIYTTKLVNGEWTSPNHSIVGARIVREFLWREYCISGLKDLQNFRETVCLLVRYHMIAPHLLESDNSEYKLIKTSANGELAPDFTIKLLMILSKADANGRISENKSKGEESVILAAELASELCCLNKPVVFPSDFSKFAYLSGRINYTDTELYDDTSSQVILLCGLPGTGKDTWIKSEYHDYPVISLDDIRRKYDLSPEGSQQQAVRIAKSRARKLLREKISFVWNATALTYDIRRDLVALFVSYHVYVKIVYLETSWDETIRRNKNRTVVVPEAVICKMLTKLSPPERFEAHQVDWLCI